MLVWVPLPVRQRRARCRVSRDDLVGGADDRLRLLLGERAAVAVHLRGGLLQDAERADDLSRELLAADLEMLERAFGLRAPVAVRGDLDRAHRVGLGAGLLPLRLGDGHGS
jgi:hypothetical protein